MEFSGNFDAEMSNYFNPFSLRGFSTYPLLFIANSSPSAWPGTSKNATTTILPEKRWKVTLLFLKTNYVKNGFRRNQEHTMTKPPVRLGEEMVSDKELSMHIEGIEPLFKAWHPAS